MSVNNNLSPNPIKKEMNSSFMTESISKSEIGNSSNKDKVSQVILKNSIKSLENKEEKKDKSKTSKILERSTSCFENNKTEDNFIFMDRNISMDNQDESFTNQGPGLLSWFSNGVSKIIRYSSELIYGKENILDKNIIIPAKAVKEELAWEKKDKIYLTALKNRYDRDNSLKVGEGWEEIDYQTMFESHIKESLTMSEVTDKLKLDLPRSRVDFNGKRLLNICLPPQFENEGFPEAKKLNIPLSDHIFFIKNLYQAGLSLIAIEMNKNFAIRNNEMLGHWYNCQQSNEDTFVECYLKIEKFILEKINTKEKEQELIISKDLEIIFKDIISSLKSEISGKKSQEIVKKEVLSSGIEKNLFETFGFGKLSLNEKLKIISLLNLRLGYMDCVKNIILPFCCDQKDIINDDPFPFSQYGLGNISENLDGNVKKKKISTYRYLKIKIEKVVASSRQEIATILAELFLDIDQKKGWKKIRVISIKQDVVK